MNFLGRMTALVLTAAVLCPLLQTAALAEEGANASKIALYPGHAEIPKGLTLKLYAHTVPESSGAAFIWQSSDSGIADVSQDGTVTAKAPGEATVTASLGQAPEKAAVCTVLVKEEGAALLYRTAPSDPPILPDPPEGPSGGEPPPGDTSESEPEAPQAPGGEEGDIPVEYDETVPVEIIPSIDEFIWTIKIDDTYEWQSNQGGMVLRVLNRLRMTGVKHGGKTPFGEYRFQGAFQSDYPEADIDAYIAPEGGSAKSQFNPTHVLSDFVCAVKPIEPSKLYPDPKDAELRAILRENYSGTASGEIELSSSGGGSVTVTGKDGSVTGAHARNLSTTFPYRLRLGKSGRVFFSYVTKARENNVFFFTGKLYKTPILPK